MPGVARKGKLLLTGGVSSVEGPAGGGLTPWAVIGSHATGQALGVSGHFTRVRTRDYALTAYGATIGWGERAELSLARQVFDTAGTGTALGLPGLQAQAEHPRREGAGGRRRRPRHRHLDAADRRGPAAQER